MDFINKKYENLDIFKFGKDCGIEPDIVYKALSELSQAEQENFDLYVFFKNLGVEPKTYEDVYVKQNINNKQLKGKIIDDKSNLDKEVFVSERNKLEEKCLKSKNNPKETDKSEAKETTKKCNLKKVLKIVAALAIGTAIVLGAIKTGENILEGREELATAENYAEYVLGKNDYHIESYDNLDPIVQYLLKGAVYEKAKENGDNPEATLRVFLEENHHFDPTNYGYSEYDYEQAKQSYENDISSQVNEYYNNNLPEGLNKSIKEMVKDGSLFERLPNQSHEVKGARK